MKNFAPMLLINIYHIVSQDQQLTLPLFQRVPLRECILQSVKIVSLKVSEVSVIEPVQSLEKLAGASKKIISYILST